MKNRWLQITLSALSLALAVMLKVPGPLYRLIFGTEWYVRRDLPPGTRLSHPLDRWPK